QTILWYPGMKYFTMQHKKLFRANLFPFTLTGGYVYQMIADCEYGDNITDMVYLVKNVFNLKLLNIYDSRVGKYISFGELGMRNAAHYNNQSWKMKDRKAEVETFCRYNVCSFFSMRYIILPPNVRVHQTKPADYGEQSVLECSVWGFYPQEMRVSWLRDGEEVTTDVFSSEVLPNGDWSFQFHSYLELTLKRGERVICRVEHSSLQESLEVEWAKGGLTGVNVSVLGCLFLCVALQ
uniref:Rano class II histocompatibility antigen, A beta chain-like n=1 Tax=Acanthochromis polyacanthus TaxID=80966 RepID=A0A3Q1FKU9_9TELE